MEVMHHIFFNQGLHWFFFRISLIVSLLIVDSPSFSFNLSDNNSRVHRDLTSGGLLYAVAMTSAFSFPPYFFDLPLRSFSCKALSRPSFKYFCLFRHIVVLSTSKKSSISISFFPLSSNRRILTLFYSLSVLLPDFLNLCRNIISFCLNFISVLFIVIAFLFL